MHEKAVCTTRIYRHRALDGGGDHRPAGLCVDPFLYAVPQQGPLWRGDSRHRLGPLCHRGSLGRRSDQRRTELDAGAVGISAVVPQGLSTHGLSVTWMADGADLAGETYTLAAQGYLPPIQ
ncbi:MAG: hypothetical protein O2971_06055 [Proteobacteria bacterium]|nr:hypothetical protein [Pseudomonadota bacterium]